MISNRIFLRFFFCLILTVRLITESAIADQGRQPFPEFLSLSEALSMLDDEHPVMLGYRVSLSEVQADLIRVDSDSSLKADLSFELRTADKSITPEVEFIDDSRSILTIDKPLTRFGQDSALRNGILTRVDALEQFRKYGWAAMRIQAMQAFFDVLSSDNEYIAVNEEMTLAYLEFQDMQELMSMDQTSEISVLEKQAVYLDLFAAREKAAGEQRASRIRLSLALNRKDSIPRELVEPDLSGYQRDLPEYDELVKVVLDNNPEARANRLQLQSANQQLESLGGKLNPVLGVRFQAAEYARNFSTNRDKYRASIYLDIPLTRERHRQIEIANLQTEVLQYESSLASAEQSLRVLVLELLQNLAYAELEKRAAEAELLYQEVSLDKVRIQYEMEYRARIGSANTRVAKALARLARVNYQIAMTWERIDALTGNDI